MSFIPIRAAFLAAAILLFAPATGLPQVTLYGVGDLPGGVTRSEVRDTTRVGTVLYAVGSSVANAGSIADDTAAQPPAQPDRSPAALARRPLATG